MVDSSYTGSGLRLNTHSFSLEELNLLIQALDINFSMNALINTF